MINSKKFDIKNPTCYYFDEMMKTEFENHMKIFWFITFQTKL